MWILITVAVAAASGFLLLKLKVPGGMLVGAILGVAILSVTTGEAYMFPQARVAAQSVTGAYIGCMMTRDRARHLPKVIRPYLVVMASLLALNLCVGVLFYHITDYDLLTCLFCAAPSGMADTPLVAMDMGADGSVVAVMQFVRSLFGLSCLPSVILLSDRLLEPEVSREMDERAKTLEKKVKTRRKASAARFLPILTVAMIAGFLGKKTGLPAGALASSFIVVSILNIRGLVPPMPMWMRRVAQAFTGSCIGCSITLAQVLQMRQLVVPMIVLCLGYITCCIVMGVVISRWFHMPLREAMLSLSPAGAGEMALIAAEMGVESTNLVVLQLGRLVGASVIFPHIFKFIITGLA